MTDSLIPRIKELLVDLPGLPPYAYTPPLHSHDHWELTDATGAILACPHTPIHPALADFLEHAPQLLHTVITALEGQTPHQATASPAERRTDAHAVPTPRETPLPQSQPIPETPGARGPVVITRTAAWMDDNGVSIETVEAILEAPEHTRPGYQGATIYSGNGYDVVLSADRQVVLAVHPRPRTSPPSPAPAHGSRERSNTRAEIRRRKATKARPARKITGDYSQFLTLALSHGFAISMDTGRHRRLTHPDHPEETVFIPSTPSDHRWALNAATEIRKRFGIDLRRNP